MLGERIVFARSNPHHREPDGYSCQPGSRPESRDPVLASFNVDTAGTDGQLLERWRAGQHKAGEALMRRHYRNVLRYFELNANHAAEDLTQRTLLACVERSTKIVDPDAFRGYLMGIARRQLAMHLRAARRVEPYDEFATVPQRTGISTLVARNAEQFLALRALASLPKRPQMLLILFYWEQMQGKDIAAALGVPASTIRSRLARARAKMQQRMEEFAGEGTFVSSDAERIPQLLQSVLNAGLS